MSHGLRVRDEIRGDIIPKIPARSLLGSVAAELVGEGADREDVDVHAGQGHIRLVRHPGRVLRLPEKRDDTVLFVDRHHPEAAGLLARHLDAADRHVGTLFHVLPQHQLVVDLVDMVPSQNHDVIESVALDDVE